MLSKKYYVQFAEMIAECQYKNCKFTGQFATGYECAIKDVEIILSDLLESDNPNFDPTRFNAYIEKRVKELSHQ